MQQLHVDGRWFDAIGNATKTFEGRLCTAKYASVRVGDKIQFIKNNSECKLTATVVSIKNYENFTDMVNDCTIEKVLPGIDAGEHLNVYHKYYKPDDIAKYGVVAIGIEI